MTYSPLQWLGPELVRKGFIRNEKWIEGHAAEAVSLFPNQGLHAAATLMAAVHPHALDYIRQAPVLVVAASYGRSLHRKSERLFVATNWGSACHRGGKLRDLMDAFKVAYPLRALDGVSLCPTRWPVLQLLSEIPPSVLAQAVPRSAGQQILWLRGLCSWLSHVERRFGPHNKRMAFKWFAAEFGKTPSKSDPSIIADFIGHNQDQFCERWTLRGAKERAEEWHRELARRSNEESFFRSHGLGFSDPIDYRPFPDAFAAGDYEIVALRSGEELFAEGAAMRHCVASYSGAVVRGRSRIFSVRRGADRVATAEFSRDRDGYSLAQVKGPCNGAPPGGVKAALDQMAKAVAEGTA